jgi:ribonuclease VapC
MSAANWLETAIRGDAVASNAFDDLVREAQVSVEAMTATHGLAARRAYHACGKGARHPVKLNFGDCFAYALAKETGEPLLFKGDDFSRTDIKAAVGSACS